MKNYLIYQKNDLIRNLCNIDGSPAILPLPQRRIVLSLMARITSKTTDFESVNIPIADFCKDWHMSAGGNQYNTIRDSVDSLIKTQYRVGDDTFCWLSYVSYVNSTIIHLRFDNRVKAFLLSLSRNYTCYRIANVIRFTSKYSYVIYECMRSFLKQGQYRMKIDDAYAHLCANQYTRPSELQHHVLDFAVQEINAYTDIFVSYRFEKYYSRSTHVLFTIQKNPKNATSVEKAGKGQRIQEGFAAAKHINAVDFLLSRHPELITRINGDYCHPEHDSLKFFGNGYHRFSYDEGGDIIQFLVDYGGYTVKDAAVEVLDFCNMENECVCAGDNTNTVKTDKNVEKKSEYAPPTVCYENYERIYRYLQGRGIPHDTVEKLVRENKLYADYGKNCVFFNGDRNGNGICMIKGTYTKPYNKITTECPNNYWYFAVGDCPNTIYVSEAPIDAISAYECNGRQDGIYTAMGGLKINTFKKIIEDFNPDGEKSIELCVDWDAAGDRFADVTLGGKYHRYMDRQSGTKDWNDVLCAGHKAMVKNDDDLNDSDDCGEIDNAESDDMVADFDDFDFIPFL